MRESANLFANHCNMRGKSPSSSTISSHMMMPATDVATIDSKSQLPALVVRAIASHGRYEFFLFLIDWQNKLFKKLPTTI